MRNFFVHIHDFLMKHRAAAFVVLAVVLVLQVLVGMRIGYKENVADFLPQDGDGGRYLSVYESLGGQGTVTAIFESDLDDPEEGHYAIIDAVDAFEAACDSLATVEGETLGLRCHVDEDVVMEAMAYIRENIALFLSDEDYERIDSLLAIDGYFDSALTAIRRMMAFPMGQVAMDAISSDPLSLFSPALQRLERLGPSEHFSIDGDVLFDTSGRGYAFVDSPYGGSDTKGNARIDNILRKAVEVTLQQVDGIRIVCVGAPIIAVGNATQIKHDSFLAMGISVVLIAVILLVSLRRKRNILLLGFSVLVGWLFALAAVSLLSTTVSIIVIGIGSVLVGIAVNYPLHFLEHFEGHPDRRETLREMVEPLVTGNITTVSAFACLVFMDSDAMRDLGLFGSLMLIGTILFVMIFLPLMVGKVESGKWKVENSDAQTLKHSSTQALKHSSILIAVSVLTIWLGIRSMNPSFDSNLHNINYMTQDQQQGLALLNGLLGDTTQQVEYVVSEGATLDEALQRQERLQVSGSKFQVSSAKGVSGIIPSTERQRQSLDGWKTMISRHSGLVAELSRKAGAYGFSKQAFEPFFKAWDDIYSPVDPSEMTQLLAMASNYIIVQSGVPSARPTTDMPTGTWADRRTENVNSTIQQVTLVNVPVDSSDSYKSSLREVVGDDESMFVFDINDVGNNLVNSLNLDFNYILYICGFVVFFFLWLSFGRLELALLAFLPLAVAWIWILGIMDLASVQFNIVNIILATFIFGQGDDYTIFITEGLIYENAYGKQRLKSYRRSVIISALLMFVGIGSLIVAKHPAMRSLAEVAIIGMAVVVAMACLLPPIVFRWLVEKKGEKRDVPITLLRLGRTFFVLLVFVLFVFVIITPYTFLYRLIGRDSERKRMRFHAMIQYFIGIAVRHIPGVKFNYDNRVGETFDKPAVIVANHQSHLDLLCVLQMTPKIVILTNNWVWRNPVYGAIIRYAEFYPVRDGFDALLPKMQSLVSRGYSIVVFPEGTRSLDGEIGRFHKGAFELAQKLGVDLLPVMIHGANHVMPKKDIVLREGQLTVEVEERIAFSSFSDKDSRLLTKEIHSLMKVMLEDMRQRIEDENYYLPFVLYQYLYKGREVARRARRNLDDYISNGVSRTGQGEVALLRALAHGKQVENSFDNEEDYLVAKTIVEKLKINNIELKIV